MWYDGVQVWLGGSLEARMSGGGCDLLIGTKTNATGFLFIFFWVWLGAGNFLGLVGYEFAEYVGKFGFEWWF